MSFEHLTQPKQEKKENLCALCGANHSVGECEKLMNFSSLNEGGRREAVSGLEQTIETSGILKLGDKGMQAVLNQLAGEDKQKIIEKLATYYKFGEFVEVKEKDGKTRKDFRAKNIKMNVPGVGAEEIIVDKTPFSFDRDFNTNVLRYHFIKENGETDPVLRVSAIDSLSYLEKGD